MKDPLLCKDFCRTRNHQSLLMQWHEKGGC
jgi:hypothetical protein